ncbi:hypothetical protein MHBO_004717, partial [Bonamia ostreae]
QSCAITNQPALYRDSVTLLPFSDKNAFSKIRRALKDKKIVPFRRSKLFRSYTIRVKKPKGWERKKIFSRKFVSYKNICFRLNKNDNEKNVKINLGKLRKLVSTQTFNTKIKTIKTDSHLKLKDSIFKDRIKNETGFNVKSCRKRLFEKPDFAVRNENEQFLGANTAISRDPKKLYSSA